jgi:6-phosphogluconolactonase
MAMQIITRKEPELYREAGAMLATSIAEVCAKQGYCILGIVGGRSLPALMERLLEHAHLLHGKIHVFWLDERIGPEKTYIPILPYLEQLHKKNIDIRWYPLQGLHIPAIEIEARQTLQTLQNIAGKHAFDIVILSAGEDGHIAALFPGHQTLLAVHPGYVIEEHAPKPPAHRITVTLPLLLSAGEAFLFITGDKQEAYDAFLSSTLSTQQCPAKFVVQIPRCTVFTSLVDTSAKHL